MTLKDHIQKCLANHGLDETSILFADIIIYDVDNDLNTVKRRIVLKSDDKGAQNMCDDEFLDLLKQVDPDSYFKPGCFGKIWLADNHLILIDTSPDDVLSVTYFDPYPPKDIDPRGIWAV